MPEARESEIDMIFFADPAYAQMGSELSTTLGIHMGHASLARFPNQELHASVQNRVANEACLILGTIAPPDEQMLTLLLLSHTLKKEGARTITTLLPYLAYARHEKPEEGASLATAWVGVLLQASGIDDVITIDVHTPAAVRRLQEQPG